MIRSDDALRPADLELDVARMWGVSAEMRPGIIRTDMTAGIAEEYDPLIRDGSCPSADGERRKTWDAPSSPWRRAKSPTRPERSSRSTVA